MRSFLHRWPIVRRVAAGRLLGSLPALSLCAGVFIARGLAEEGLRRIEAPRFGVVVMAPGGWQLTEWSENDRAFVLHLPQEKVSSDGYVRCELASAPERLADYQKQNRELDERERRSSAARRKLVSDSLETIGAAAKSRTSEHGTAGKATAEKGPGEKGAGESGPGEKGGAEKNAAPRQRLVTVWELLDDDAKRGADGVADSDEDKRFEVAVRVVRHETLYTFTLITDEAHFAAYRADFDDLVAGAELTQPDAGLKAVANGYWLQPEFQFGLRPPAGWKPAFGASDRALWFAHGAAHGVFVDNMTVAASALAPLNLAALRDGAAEAIVKSQPAARLVACQIVPQGALSALETILASEQFGAPVTIIERQFTGSRRNYHIRVTCQSAAFKEQEAEIRKSLDSFREAAEQAPPQDL